MSNHHDHGAHVDDWLRRVVDGAGPERLVGAFEEAFSALSRRASLTLGDITVLAIVDRVFYVAAERFPVLAAVQVDATGVRLEQLRPPGGDADRVMVDAALRFVLVEFLTVLGNLTAEILSPALHAELSDHARPAAAAEAKTGDGTKP